MSCSDISSMRLGDITSEAWMIPRFILPAGKCRPHLVDGRYSAGVRLTFGRRSADISMDIIRKTMGDSTSARAQIYLTILYGKLPGNLRMYGSPQKSSDGHTLTVCIFTLDNSVSTAREPARIYLIILCRPSGIPHEDCRIVTRYPHEARANISYNQYGIIKHICVDMNAADMCSSDNSSLLLLCRYFYIYERFRMTSYR